MDNLDELLIMLMYLLGWLVILAIGAFISDVILPKLLNKGE